MPAPAVPQRPATSRPAVVLVRPQHEGNVGAAARAMANMGLSQLHLVDPAPRLGATARAFAVGAGDILDQVQHHDSLRQALAGFERAVGTTSGRHRQLQQSVITARELGGLLALEPSRSVALVFGPEASGLTNDEIALLDPLVTIPCAQRQPTLNLAQAVLLIAYELQLLDPTDMADAPAAPTPAPLGEVERLFTHAEELLRSIGFERDDTYDSVLRDLRQMAARTGPSAREVQIFHGICRRALNALRLARQ